MNLKGFLAGNYENQIKLGTSDAWSTIHLSHRPSEIYHRLTDLCIQLCPCSTRYPKPRLMYNDFA